MDFKIILLGIMLTGLVACDTNVAKIKNDKKGELKASAILKECLVKKFQLDNESAPKPRYIQLYEAKNGTRYFTFLNTYKNTIYMYDYDSFTFVKKIAYNKKGPNGILDLEGYHILSMDSIYAYDMSTMEIVHTNDRGEVIKKISLRRNEKGLDWLFRYPQYLPETSKPFIATSKELLLTGQSMRNIPETFVKNIKFTSRLDLNTNQVSYSHRYPLSLYGNNYNWNEQFFTEVFSDLHPDGDKLVYSFPVSHDIYIGDLTSGNTRAVYGGSNFAGTIRSINKSPKQMSRELIESHIIKYDTYASIKYDKYRRVYYRFLRKAIPNANIHSRWENKMITIIIMDENFNYLGETEIGIWGDWYWQNAFVSKEGLNIEYLEKDIEEVFITLKIFTIRKI